MSEDLKRLLIHDDPVIFSKEVLHWIPDPIQEQVLLSTAQQIICNCHRQWGKSQTIAIKTLHNMWQEANELALISSHTEKQAAEMFLKIYQDSLRAGIQRKDDSKRKMTLFNDSRIVTMCGSEASVRGYSAPRLIIIDEASRAIETLYEALRPMMISGLEKVQLILISTPNGKQGFFYDIWSGHGKIEANDPEAWKDLNDGWERYRVTAYENPRIPQEWLQAEAEDHSERYMRQEYGCEFVETEDQAWSYDLIAAAFGQQVAALHETLMDETVQPLLKEQIFSE